MEGHGRNSCYHVKHMKNSKNLVFSIVTILIGLAVGFMIVETVVRVLRLEPALAKEYANNVADPYLPYKPKPLSVTPDHSVTGEFDCEYRHNSFGFRDREHTLEKGENVFRILGLGDSFTYGIGVGFEATYLYRLEAMLNTRPGEHPPIEIIKAGIPRYYPEPQRILLGRYGKDYSPDFLNLGLAFRVGWGALDWARWECWVLMMVSSLGFC